MISTRLWVLCCCLHGPAAHTLCCTRCSLRFTWSACLVWTAGLALWLSSAVLFLDLVLCALDLVSHTLPAD
jgi:hypothetical protein